MSFFFVIVTLTAIYGYFGLRVIHPLQWAPKYKSALWMVLFVFYATIPLAMVLRFGAPEHPAAIPLAWLAYLSLGFFALTFSALLVRDVILLVGWLPFALVRRVRRFGTRSEKRTPPDFSRRQFIVNSTNLAVLGLTGSLTAYGLAEARGIPQTIHTDVPLANLPPQFDGLRILQITDLHVGLTIRRDYVQRVVQQANDKQPDIIVITGDLADGRVVDLQPETEPLADLTAPLGKFYITGNHEYYHGAEEWIEEARRLGFTPLLNEHRTVNRDDAGIVLAGVTDYRAARILPHHATNPHRSLTGAPQEAPKIMLAHQPKSVFGAEAAGADLVISGHTHGGQVIPWNYLVPLDQPYVHGLHRHGNAWIYVSRGTGYWGPPMRVGSPSEISVLQLVQQSV